MRILHKKSLNKDKTYKDQPKPYDERVVTKFLWLPKRIKDETRWLETTTWIEKYTINVSWGIFTVFTYFDWKDWKWVDED